MAHEELHLNLRNLEVDDYGQLQVLMDRIYDDIGGAWPVETIRALVRIEPLLIHYGVPLTEPNKHLMVETFQETGEC